MKLYILPMWEEFFYIISLCINIAWELCMADLSHNMLLLYGSLFFVCCTISVLDFIQYQIVQDDFYYL